jgi:hypothetical protein
MLEANNVDLVFQELDEGEDIPIGYEFVLFHMIFDDKSGSLTREVQYIARGQMTEPLSANICHCC